MSKDKTKRNKLGNRIEIEGQVLKVYLNNNNNNDEPFLFDLDDLEILKEYTVVKFDGKYAMAWDSERKRNVYLHRVVMDVADKTGDKSYHVDHINGKEWDNRKSNLRICHEDDASNRANPQYEFWGTDRVIKYRRPDDRFALNISNGIVNKLDIIYPSFNELIGDYKLLYKLGTLDGLNHILKRTEKFAVEGLNKFEKGTDMYLLYYSNYQQLQTIRQQIKEQKEEIERLTQQIANENGNVEKGFHMVGSTMILVGNKEEHRKSFRLLEGRDEINVAGLHELKPNGELIYKN